MFTGSGFSLDTISRAGSTTPSAAKLQQLLWDLCFPGEMVDPAATLSDLFGNAQLRHKARLGELLSQQFHIRPESVGTQYEETFSFPWHRVYTVNVDDLAEVTNRKFKLPRELRKLSAFPDHYRAESYNPSSHLQVVHLNGHVDDGPDNLTFSTLQYGERLASHDPWYLALVSELMTRPFVFVGTSLQEPSLWQYIELRQTRGERGMRELRPRSYFVTPTLDRARQSLLAEYNVEWLPLTTAQFAQAILAPLRSARDTGLRYLASGDRNVSRLGGSLQEVSALAVKPLEKTEYLLGAEPEWSDIQSGRAIVRACDRSLLDTADRVLRERVANQALLITGTAGTGKSSSLKRLALAIAASGTRVGWIDRTTEMTPRAVKEAFRNDDGPRVLAIDDADTFGAELASIVKDATSAANRPLVLLGIRASRTERVLNPSLLGPVQIIETVMPPLEDGDIDGLLASLDSDNRLGILKAKAIDVQRAVFRDKAGRQLLVAMIEATSGKKFEERAETEFNDLEAEAQLVYALITVASSFRYSLARDEILLAAGVEASNKLMNAMDQLLRRHIIVADQNGTLRARHRVIAELILEALRKAGKLPDVLFGLATVMAVKAGGEGTRKSRESRLLSAIVNHDFLARSIGPEQSRNLFGKLENLLSWDFQYWLQRGSLELEIGSLSLAENFLNQARSISPDNPFVQTEFAFLCFRKALQEPGKLNSPDLVADAITQLRALIATRGRIDYYPYHVFGSQGLAWARRGITDTKQKTEFLNMLLAMVSEGCEKHRSSTELAKLHTDLKKAILEQAIPSR